MQPQLTPRDRLIQDQLLSKYALSESIINMTSSSLFAASADPSPSDASFAAATTSRLKTESGVIKTSGTIASSSLDDALPSSSRGAAKSSIETAKISPSRSSQVKTLTKKVNNVLDKSTVVTSTSKFNVSPIQQQKKTQQTTTTSSSPSVAQSSTREVSSGPSSKMNLYQKPTIGSLNRSTTIPPKATRPSVLVKRAAYVSPPSLPVVISAVPIRSRYAQRARDLPKTTSQPSPNPVSSSSLLNEEGIQERNNNNNNNNNAISNTIADVAPTSAVFDLNGDTSFSSPSGLTSSSVKDKGLHSSSKALKQVRGPINTRGSSSRSISKSSSPIVISTAAAAALSSTPTNLAVAPDVSQSLSSLSQQQQQQQHFPSSINNDNNRSSLVLGPDSHLQGEEVEEEEEQVGQEEEEQQQEERNSFLDRTGVIIRNEELQRTLDAVDSAVEEASRAAFCLLK